MQCPLSKKFAKAQATEHVPALKRPVIVALRACCYWYPVRHAMSCHAHAVQNHAKPHITKFQASKVLSMLAESSPSGVGRQHLQVITS